jgi:uncharacterized protein YtpQ (UPF0354 family)
VQYFAELILQSKDSDSAETRMDLTHAYTTYQQSPESLERLIKERLDLMKDQQSTAQLETKDIIPVIKDRQWHEGLLAQSKLLGGKDIGVYVEDFVGDLIVIYAEDRPSSIRYLSHDQLQTTGLTPDKWRNFALNNLLKKVEIATHKSDIGGMIVAGGNYESSLLLLRNLWDDLARELQDDVVVAVPTRDVVMFTAANNQVGVSRLITAAQGSRNQSYAISEGLFIYKEGCFLTFAG